MVSVYFGIFGILARAMVVMVLNGEDGLLM